MFASNLKDFPGIFHYKFLCNIRCVLLVSTLLHPSSNTHFICMISLIKWWLGILSLFSNKVMIGPIHSKSKFFWRLHKSFQFSDHIEMNFCSLFGEHLIHFNFPTISSTWMENWKSNFSLHQIWDHNRNHSETSFLKVFLKLS